MSQFSQLQNFTSVLTWLLFKPLHKVRLIYWSTSVSVAIV